MIVRDIHTVDCIPGLFNSEFNSEFNSGCLRCLRCQESLRMIRCLRCLPESWATETHRRWTLFRFDILTHWVFHQTAGTLSGFSKWSPVCAVHLSFSLQKYSRQSVESLPSDTLVKSDTPLVILYVSKLHVPLSVCVWIRNFECETSTYRLRLHKNSDMKLSPRSCWQVHLSTHFNIHLTAVVQWIIAIFTCSVFSSSRIVSRIRLSNSPLPSNTTRLLSRL